MLSIRQKRQARRKFQGKTMTTFTSIIFIAIAGLWIMASLANPADDWNDKHIS
jgi:hypothetical protein